MNHQSDLTDNNNYIYTPVGFDPADHPGFIAAHPDAARWLLNCVYFRQVVRNYKDNKPVKLHSDLLAKVYGSAEYVTPLRKAAEEAGLIWCNHSYVRNLSSFSYALGPKIQGSKWCQCHVKGRRFAKRIQAFKDYVQNPSGFKCPTHDHLSKWVHAAYFDDSFNVQDLEYKNAGKCDVAELQVDLIRRKLIHLTVCPYGRFHSNYSGLCRELRPHVRIDGQSLVEIDIKNSQPYFLALLLSSCLSSQNSVVSCSRSHLSNLLSFPLSTPESQGTKHQPYDLCFEDGLWDLGRDTGVYSKRARAIEVADLEETDIERMLRKTAEGTFYEDFVEASHMTRDRVKRKVFMVLMGKRSLMKHSSLGETFRRLYPTTFEMMDTLKKKKGYRWVGQELQRLESHAMITGVCRRLMEDHPEIPIITVHDSLLTPSNHLPVVRSVLDDWFSQFPLPPTFKVT